MLNPTINKSISEFLEIINRNNKNSKIKCIYIEKYNSYYIIVDNNLFTNKEFINDFWEFESRFINNFPSSSLIAYSEDNSKDLIFDSIEIYRNEDLFEIA